jgi:hypothetical protein
MTDTFQAEVDRRHADRMAHFDALPEDIRDLIHEYGANVVNQMRQCGVLKARHIRHLVETVLDELSPARTPFSAQGPKTALSSNRGVPTGWQLVPMEPTAEMVDASQQTLAIWRASLTPDERMLHSRIVGGRQRTYMAPRDKHASRYRAMLAAAPKGPA